MFIFRAGFTQHARWNGACSKFEGDRPLQLACSPERGCIVSRVREGKEGTIEEHVEKETIRSFASVRATSNLRAARNLRACRETKRNVDRFTSIGFRSRAFSLRMHSRSVCILGPCAFRKHVLRALATHGGRVVSISGFSSARRSTKPKPSAEPD